MVCLTLIGIRTEYGLTYREVQSLSPHPMVDSRRLLYSLSEFPGYCLVNIALLKLRRIYMILIKL